VASSRPADDGYATPAAVVFSLALSLVATAMLARSLTLLKQAEANFARTEAELGLDGAQLLAAAQIIRAGGVGPFRWQFSTSLGWIEARAEPEAAKVVPAAAGQGDGALFEKLGVRDVAALRSRLEASPDDLSLDVEAQDEAPLWRLCAGTFISGRGAAQAPQAPQWEQPLPGKQTANWHVAELWRIRVRSDAGWVDDRIVRFTGDAQHPAATVQRRFSRNRGDWGRCDAVLAG